MANPRTKARIEARILERLAYCLEFELKDPRSTFVTLTRVEVSNDLSVAKVFYTVLGDQSDRRRMADVLESASGFLRQRLTRVLNMRRLPHLRWIYDPTVALQAEMEATIQDAMERDRAINPEAHLDGDQGPVAPVDPPSGNESP